MGHDFSGQITEKCGTKYENGNYILGHLKWKLYFGTEGVLLKVMQYIFRLSCTETSTCKGSL